MEAAWTPWTSWRPAAVRGAPRRVPRCRWPWSAAAGRAAGGSSRACRRRPPQAAPAPARPAPSRSPRGRAASARRPCPSAPPRLRLVGVRTRASARVEVRGRVRISARLTWRACRRAEWLVARGAGLVARPTSGRGVARLASPRSRGEARVALARVAQARRRVADHRAADAAAPRDGARGSEGDVASGSGAVLVPVGHGRFPCTLLDLAPGPLSLVRLREHLGLVCRVVEGGLPASRRLEGRRLRRRLLTLRLRA